RAVRGERTNVEARHDDRLLAHSRETGGVIEHFPLEQDPVESLTYLAIRDPAHVLTQMSGHSAERLLSGISGYCSHQMGASKADLLKSRRSRLIPGAGQ